MARISPGILKVLDDGISMNLVSTTCLAPDHSGLEVMSCDLTIRFKLGRCSTFPTDE